jgi:hypothetical protein
LRANGKGYFGGKIWKEEEEGTCGESDKRDIWKMKGGGNDEGEGGRRKQTN